MVLNMKIYTILIAASLMMLSLEDTRGQNARLRYADKQFELLNLINAAEGYEKAFEKKETYRAAKGAAVSYQLLSSYQEAFKWWKTAIGFEESDRDDFNRYIYSAHQAGALEEVKAALDEAPAALRLPQGSFNLDSLEFWYENPAPLTLQSVAGLNSPAADFGIMLDEDGNSYFSSDRGQVSNSGKKSIRVDGAYKFDTQQYGMTGRDFLGIYRKDGNNQIQAIKSPVPHTFHSADPFLMQAQPVMFYTVTRDLEKEGKGRNLTIYPEIYFSKINDKGELVDYTAFSLNSPTEYGVINPFVDEQERKVYFASDMPGGMGGYDIYYVSYDGQFAFGPAVNLGPAINTAGDERDPFQFEDSFYFSSNGHTGLGGLDIFHAHYKEGTFSAVRNLGLPFNSPQDDFSLLRTGSGEVYLSSNRESNQGLDDIYKIENLYARFVGKVRDTKGNPITEGLEVELTQKDSRRAIDTEQPEKGTVQALVAPDTDYQLVLQKRGYFPVRDAELSTRGLKGERLEREYVMEEIPYNYIVLEDLIYYDYGKARIRQDAEPTMRKVAELMKTHTFLEITVRSHTDSRSSNEFNEALSQRRANAVRDYLQDYGIARSRVKSEWFGEEQLVNDCGDGVPCPESAHQLNRRSELILKAFPDENKAYEVPVTLEDIDLEEIGATGNSR